MPRDPRWADNDDEFDDDGSDYAPDDEPSETVPCPECGADVYEDAERCGHCGLYITHDTRVLAGRSWWWIALGLLGVAAVIAALTGLLGR